MHIIFTITVVSVYSFRLQHTSVFLANVQVVIASLNRTASMVGNLVIGLHNLTTAATPELAQPHPSELCD
jgi:hypothetical protein